MRLRFTLLLGVLLLGACDLSVPNGLFGCGQAADCPSGYYCWGSDSRCYDSKEPECAPRSCEEIIADFASLGIPIECGALPDGCEGSIECGACPQDEICGANGQNFICGCEENSCATFAGGAECGVIPTRCGGGEQALFCGTCLGIQICVDNRCICPVGADCGEGCGDRCGPQEVCVEGECCEPIYPCSDNECSPPGGFPDGCGGVAQCAPCRDGEDCVLSNALVFECLGDCTCEAQGVECGNATICGSPTLCGTCQDNGFEDGFRCQSGRCVCADQFESNDQVKDATVLCGPGVGSGCMQDVWGVEVQATLHDSQDLDYYEARVLDAPTPLIAHVTAGSGDRLLFLTYLCPDGKVGLDKCSGWEEEIDGIRYCISDWEPIVVERRCESGSTGDPGSAVGTVRVIVAANQFNGTCDPYDLQVLATYQLELPGDF